jgi:hypothetical protein
VYVLLQVLDFASQRKLRHEVGIDGREIRNDLLKLEPPLGRHPALCVGLQLHDARPLVPAREVRVIVQVLLLAHCLAEW